VRAAPVCYGLDVAPTIDPGDFDSFVVVADLVVALRRHTMDRGVDVIASVSAPPGRHELRIVARPGGHVVLAIRYDDLTLSRHNVLAEALHQRGWDTDEDREGATRRFPPGTEHTAVAFEVLEVITLGGAPAEPRDVTAVDATGTPVALD
jgi:hypothetical protein